MRLRPECKKNGRVQTSFFSPSSTSSSSSAAGEEAAAEEAAAADPAPAAAEEAAARGVDAPADGSSVGVVGDGKLAAGVVVSEVVTAGDAGSYVKAGKHERGGGTLDSRRRLRLFSANPLVTSAAVTTTPAVTSDTCCFCLACSESPMATSSAFKFEQKNNCGMSHLNHVLTGTFSMSYQRRFGTLSNHF